jgi:TPR repeat protein
MTMLSAHADDFSDGVDAYVKGDYAAAYRLWKPLADGEDPVAMFNIAVLHAQGLGIPQDPQTAAQWYLRAAQGAYAPAQFNLGVAYLQGLGLPEDPGEARDWFLRAAEQDHRQAQYNLGSLYWQGLGVEADPVAARQWFQKAADAGDDRATEALALIEAERDNPPLTTPVEPAAARPGETVAAGQADVADEGASPVVAAPAGWIARQAPDNFTVQLFADRSAEGAIRFMEKNEIPAMARFTSRTGWHKIIAGSFVTREEALRAVRAYPDEVRKLKPWVRRMFEVQGELSEEPLVALPGPADPRPREPAAPTEQNPAPATRGGKAEPDIADRDADPAPPKPADPDVSMNPEQRLVAAQQALGEQDFVTARRYWEPLAESGQAEAQYGLGFLYESGLGLARSDKSAFDWYRQAAEQSHPRAQFNLGILYMEGRGVVPNEGLGLYWIQSAADKNDARAREYLVEFRASLSAAPDD